MIKHTRTVTTIAAAITAVLAGNARAQTPPTAPSSDIAEIVVTAQKRTERLQDVPLAVTVVGEEQLAEQHIYTLADLARTSPSLEMIQAFGGPGGGGQIRGIGTQSFTRSAEGAVGVVVDGVPQGNVPNPAIFDLARVEVLRGPQGTLFGLTSSAGVINMVTVAPDPRALSGYAHVDYSDGGTLGSKFGQQTVRAAINLPLGDASALRLSANGNRLDGVERNAATGENNVQKDGGIRARFLWTPSDALTVNLSADFDKKTQNYGDPQFVYVDVPPGTPLAAQLADCGIVASYANNERCSNVAANTDVKNYGLSAQLDWTTPVGTVTSITGWRKTEQSPSTVDIMGNPQDFAQILINGATNDGRQFSQEVRLASPTGGAVDYVTGVFFSDYQAHTGYGPGGEFIVGSYQIVPGAFIPLAQDPTTTATTSRSEAAFGQMTYHVTSRLGLIAGLRYTHIRLTDFQSANPTNGAPALSGEVSDSNVSGKVGVEYKISDSVMTYASFTRGYKGPQVLTAAQGNSGGFIGAEKPSAYELGLKGSALNGRIGYDLSAFYTDVKDFQGQRCSINGAGVLTCTGQSIPTVNTKGIELDLFGHPVKGLTLNAGFVYNDARFPQGWTGYNPDDLRTAQPGTLIGQTDMSGLQLVGVAKTKLTLSGEYSHQLGSIEGFMGADAVHKSSERLAYSGDSRFVYPGHWTVGARAGLRAPSNSWSVELYARNIGNEHEPATLFGGPSFVPPGAIPFLPNGFVTGISGWTAPTSLRQVGLSAEVRW